jgi:hypothetical protein
MVRAQTTWIRGNLLYSHIILNVTGTSEMLCTNSSPQHGLSTLCGTLMLEGNEGLWPMCEKSRTGAVIGSRSKGWHPV